MLGDAEAVSVVASKDVEVYLMPALRSGARMGDAKAIDAMVAVLTGPVRRRPHGITAEPGRQTRFQP